MFPLNFFRFKVTKKVLVWQAVEPAHQQQKSTIKRKQQLVTMESNIPPTKKGFRTVVWNLLSNGSDKSKKVNFILFGFF